MKSRSFPQKVVLVAAALTAGMLWGCASIPDSDGDGYDDSNDCAPWDADVHPDAEERCDGVDQDCDDRIDEGVSVELFADRDGDGFGDPENAGTGCEAESGQVLDATDCDDSRASVYPGAAEVCDLVDNDCDGEVDEDASGTTSWYLDIDGDGYGDPAFITTACPPPEGYVADGTDCDDGDAARSPGVTELCNGIDDDCNGIVDTDSADASVWYEDIDQDGYGDPTRSSRACEGVPGTVLDGTDCNDVNPDVNPGAVELCNDLDDDCDGGIDEDLMEVPVSYLDADGDGYGDAATSTSQCPIPSGYVTTGTDCDDTDFAIYPGQHEDCDDTIDNDCDGEIDGCGISGTIDLEDADSDIVGEDEADNAGWSVAGVGDVNGDGQDDVLIGARLEGEGGAYTGAAYLLYGPIAGPIDLSNASAKLVGEDAYDLAGVSVAGAGDVNRDGYDDLLIGGCVEETGGLSAGAAYLVYGPVTGDRDLAAADVKFVGEDPLDFAGITVAGAGDVNDDGYDDVLIGAILEESGSSYAGAAYLFFGPVGAGTYDLAEADARFEGESNFDSAGMAIAGAGDVNKDGISDILVGAPLANAGGIDRGAAYLFQGPIEAGTHSLASADAIIQGDADLELAGVSVATGGDVNGDGYHDVLVGAFTDSGGEDAGGAYLFYGPLTGSLRLTDADASFIGETAYDLGGFKVAFAGDTNGDGYDDLLIAAIGDDTGGADAGIVYLMYGPLSGRTDLSQADAAFIGEHEGDMAGRSLSKAGDMNADGLDDILIGAPGADTGGAGAGAVYLIFGERAFDPT